MCSSFLNVSCLFRCGVDDASGTCCCWVDSERAAAFLGLESQEYLLQVLEQHGRIVVKNYGDMFDSSCHDLTFSVERFLSSCDEEVLGSLISNALFSTSWVSFKLHLQCECCNTAIIFCIVTLIPLNI